VSIDPEKVALECPREASAVHVGLSFWKRLGFDQALGAAQLSERTRMLTCAMVMNRLSAPASKHAMPAWIQRTALSDRLDVNFNSLSESALYRNMDRLYPKREVIESALVERERELFNLDQTIFFYDLTSTYFEGQALANPKAKRSYSRDKRPDCKQVVVGLVINRDGFPQAHEIFDGNTQDRASLPTMLERLEARVGVFRLGQMVVIDRDMAFDENLEQLRARGLHYLVASRQPERNRWLAQFEDLEGFEEVKPSVGSRSATCAWRATTTSPLTPTRTPSPTPSTKRDDNSPSASMAAMCSRPTASIYPPRRRGASTTCSRAPRTRFAA
jgi:hypothetical protein